MDNSYVVDGDSMLIYNFPNRILVDSPNQTKQ